MLNDEAQKIILNTKGIMKDLSDELLEFLAYVEDSTDDTIKHVKGNLVKNIHKRVQEVKNDILMEVHIVKKCEAQSRTYMTLLERDREKIEEGKVELLIKQLIKKFKIIPDQYKEKLKSLSEENIDLIATEIFDMKSIVDLKKYF